ncbi:hypothetical protein Dvul_0632 [Nitratidesulfovibrio vulgaris DP4]|uniref:Uncharacterized protein n=1 Tax=Nitratidesulfovibrio vulgaris (strain DP4) TaxID=391774 RepID=A0A0H3A5B3_NITV4|nr:hypothetical protein Dvul_0632 [Nitratidesulfovibrio vulgaris DP4]
MRGEQSPRTAITAPDADGMTTSRRHNTCSTSPALMRTDPESTTAAESSWQGAGHDTGHDTGHDAGQRPRGTASSTTTFQQ